MDEIRSAEARYDDVFERASQAATAEERAASEAEIELLLRSATAPGDHGRLLMCRARLRSNQWRTAEVYEDARAAMKLFELADEPDLAVDAASWAAAHASRMGEVSAASELVTKSLLALPSVTDGRVRLEILNRLGIFCISFLDYDRAIEQMEASLAEAERIGDQEKICRQLYNVADALLLVARQRRLANVQTGGEELDRAEATVRQLLARATDEFKRRAATHRLLAEALCERDRVEEALAVLDRFRDQTDSVVPAAQRAALAWIEARCLRRAGQPERAVVAARRAVTIARASDDDHELMLALEELAASHEAAGDAAEALATAREVKARMWTIHQRQTKQLVQEAWGRADILRDRAQQEVWRAESLSRMAGGIAHHFNNLLLVVMGNLELALQELSAADPARSTLDQAMQASQRAAEIGHLMLAYLGQTTGRKEPLDLAAVIRSALPLQVTSLPKQVRLETQLPAEAGPVIVADAVHVEQILGNLLTNAVESVGGDSGEVQVRVGLADLRELRRAKLLPAEWAPEAGSFACLTVTDTGPGLEADSIERIFEPFYSTKSTGRGLGLPVALGLARSHGGAIAVETHPGGGSSFHVLFPLQPASPPAPEPPPAGPAGEQDELVLLVDDEPMVLGVASAQLKQLGFDVVTAATGMEALERFRERGHQIRLVLLDLVMPGMDAWETLTKLRTLEPGIHVVMISGYDEAQVMRGDQPHRPQAFLHKPYDLNDLKRAIATALGTAPAPPRATAAQGDGASRGKLASADRPAE
jgi:signal transduction histidine kinase/FixJ family two-component response regulator/ribosomal protein L17